MKQKGLAPIIIIVLVAIVASGVYFLGTKNISRLLTILPSPLFSPSPTPTPDPTANWKTYNNDAYKYSFKYPSSWKINTTSPHTTYLETGSVDEPQTFARVSISETGENNKSVEELARSWRSGTVEKIQVGGEEAAKVLQNPNPEGEPLVQGGYTISIFVKNKSNINLLIQLETANLNTYQTIFDQILSTFKFAD